MSQIFITQGRIHHVGETEEHGDRGFRVRKIVLARDEEARFPNYIPFSGIYEMTDTIGAFAERVGEMVEVGFVLEGRADKKDPTRFWGTNQLRSITSLADDFNAEKPEPMGDDTAPF